MASVALRCICCVACIAYDNLETVRRPTKTDFKVGFQAAVRNATNTMHAGHATQIKKTATHMKNATDARTESVACVAFLACVRCLFQFFLIASQAVRPLRCMLPMTTWKQQVVGVYIGLCDIKLFVFL